MELPDFLLEFLQENQTNEQTKNPWETTQPNFKNKEKLQNI